MPGPCSREDAPGSGSDARRAAPGERDLPGRLSLAVADHHGWPSACSSSVTAASFPGGRHPGTPVGGRSAISGIRRETEQQPAPLAGCPYPRGSRRSDPREARSCGDACRARENGMTGYDWPVESAPHGAGRSGAARARLLGLLDTLIVPALLDRWLAGYHPPSTEDRPIPERPPMMEFGDGRDHDQDRTAVARARAADSGRS